MLADEDYARRTHRLVGQQRQAADRAIAKLPGLHVYPSAANFLLVRLDRPDVTAPQLGRALLRQGIAIRTFDAAQHLDGRFFRVAVRTAEENQPAVRGPGGGAVAGVRCPGLRTPGAGVATRIA